MHASKLGEWSAPHLLFRYLCKSIPLLILKIEILQKEATTIRSISFRDPYLASNKGTHFHMEKE
jgi:hypothetical protein